jgi:hypothetical protein
VGEIMDGLLLQIVAGLGEAPLVPTDCEIWEWLQGEKETVAREILSEGPLCQSAARQSKPSIGLSGKLIL